jgi:hypothetical protein
MLSQEDIDEQLELLRIYRWSLQHYLKQQAMFGPAYVPLHIAFSIDDARDNIGRIKTKLRNWGQTIEDLAGDEAPVAQPAVAQSGPTSEPSSAPYASGRTLPLDSGGRVLELPDYAHYYPPIQVQKLIKDILAQPGYHLVEAVVGMGKTALVGYLWRTQVPVRPVVLQLFSSNYRHVSIEKALTSLQQQYLDILTPGPEKHYRGENIAETLNNLLRLAGEQGKRLLVLIDGVDESDIGERNLWLPQLLPDINVVDRFSMATIVVTTRPDTKRNLLEFLPPFHPLHDAPRHILAPFTFGDINSFLNEELKLADDGTITQRVFDLTGGYPFAVHELGESAVSAGGDPAALAEEPETPTMDRVWERNLRALEQSSSDDSQLLKRLIALGSAAKSGLRLEDIVSLLAAEPSAISALLGKTSRYFPKLGDDYVLLNEHFRMHVSNDEAYRADVSAARQLLRDWILSYAKEQDTARIPFYVLRNASEYLADTPDLRQLFIRRDWFEELQQRTHSRTACRDAVLRAWTAADLAMLEATEEASINTQAVNVIACALMQASFTASLLPELILKAVEFKFWNKEEAADYASFCGEADREAVLAGLRDLRSRAYIPEKSKAAEAERELKPIRNLKGAARARGFRAWLRKWEQLGTDETQRLDTQNLVRQIATTLGEPAEPAEDAGHDFQELFERLQKYIPPPTGEISDEYFDLLTSLQGAWQQMQARSVAQNHLPLILRPIARTSRASLLGALDVLAPALVALFPNAVAEIRDAIDSIVSEYL